MAAQARYAAVRPRIIPYSAGATVILEHYLRAQCVQHATGVIGITGGPGAGKTAALEHLAATCGNLPQVLLLDEPNEKRVRKTEAGALVVYAAAEPLPVRHLELLYLAPWGEDDWIEYLLAVHKTRCADVMARIRAADDQHLLIGLPLLCTAALDAFAADEMIRDIASALRHHLQPHLTRSPRRRRAEIAGLELTLAPTPASETGVQKLRRYRLGDQPTRLLRLRPIQLVLAVDAVLRDLSEHAPCDYLARTLPPELVSAVGDRISADAPAREHLAELFARGDRHTQPMIASLLYAANKSWRPRPDQLVSLTGAYLEQARWPGVDLTGANLARVCLSGANLTGAHLDDTYAHEARLRHSRLHGASFCRCSAEEADLSGADLSFARGTNAHLLKANLVGANLEGALLRAAELDHARLSGARFVRANLSRATLCGAAVDEADFRDANFESADLQRLDLTVADFTGARFAGANLRRCNLEYMCLPAGRFADADLTGANLTGSSIPSGCFTNARLCQAGLADVDWERADLRGADLRHASFHMGSSRSGLISSPLASEGSRTGFYTDEFDEQTFRAPEEIRKANLRGADLRDALLTGVDFYLVDLRDAVYDPEQRDHFLRCGAILESRV